MNINACKKTRLAAEGCFLCSWLAAVALTLSAHGGVITVDRCFWNRNTKKYDLQLSGLPANTAVIVNIVKGDILAGETRTRVGPAMSDGMGKWSVAGVDGTMGRFFEVSANLGGGAGVEIWENIARADSGRWVSRQQKAARMRGMTKARTNGLPVVATSSVYVDETDHFQIDNTSSDTYAFTMLRIYKDLDMSYFGTDQFDSAAAIATGLPIVDFDFDSETDDFLLGPTMSASTPGGAAFLISPVSLGRYQLIVGEIARWLSDGTLGSPVSFTFAHAVPEPCSVGSLIVAAICYVGNRRRLLLNTPPRLSHHR